MFRSNVIQSGGTKESPDYIYFNADIINNETKDQASLGVTVQDPQIRFNETRDTAIVKNASEYYFSIVRFTMNGANKDLPLFIPTIQQGTGQRDVNLTTYSVAISYQQQWNVTPLAGGAPVAVNFNIAPNPLFLEYVSETQNPQIAPIPRNMASPSYAGIYSISTSYQIGNIVSTIDPTIVLTPVPYYQILTPVVWSSTSSYLSGDFVSYGGTGYIALLASRGQTPSSSPASWVKGVQGTSFTDKRYWNGISTSAGQTQDLSSRYYWVYTYQHWLDLVNQTLLLAHNSGIAGNGDTIAGNNGQGTYSEFRRQWALVTADPFPYPTFADFQAVVNTPQIIYNNGDMTFTIFGDSDGFGQRITAFTPAVLPALGPVSVPVTRLFFNSNMFGLFSNFNNTYWNDYFTSLNPSPFYNVPTSTAPDGTSGFNSAIYTPIPAPVGYVNEILFTNKFYTNVVDYRVPPYAPSSTSPSPLGYVPAAMQKFYWTTVQDYSSVDSLWSHISSVVFTSTLLPIKAEQTGAPVLLGAGNIGFSTATVPSAFQPIITDISLDTSSGGAADYRKFIYYAPTAEYRLTDFGASHQDIRNIDIQVYWKNRLDNQLYPITMFNLSSVSLKCMFRKKDAHSGKADRTMVQV